MQIKKKKEKEKQVTLFQRDYLTWEVSFLHISLIRLNVTDFDIKKVNFNFQKYVSLSS